MIQHMGQRRYHRIQNGKFLMAGNRQEKIEPSRIHIMACCHGWNLPEVLHALDHDDFVWCALWARWIQLETEVQRTSEWGIIYYTWCNELGTYKRMHPSVYGVVFRSLILTGCSRVYGRMLSRLLFFVIFGWIRTTSTSRGLACYSKTCSENCPSKNRDIALWMYIPAYLVRCAAPNFTNLEAH